MKQPFVIYYRPGPAWIEGKSVFEQPLQAHLAYMRSLTAAGTLRIGGPFTDDCGGLIVVDAASGEEAQAIFEADPAVRDRIMVAQAHPWKLMAGAL
ncbi:MAG: YciI family protein [Variovorax sp.]